MRFELPDFSGFVAGAKNAIDLRNFFVVGVAVLFLAKLGDGVHTRQEIGDLLAKFL